jgi:periplasmic protein TonB
MSIHTAVRDSLVIPPVKDFVDSFAESATAAFRTLDRYGEIDTSTQRREEVAQAPASAASMASPWNAPAQIETTSRLGKSGAFALVVLVHVVVVYVLSLFAPELRNATVEPLQVVNITAPVSDVDAPPPPVPVLRLPELSAPIEPEIAVEVVATTSITVATRPVEPAPAGATGVPKLVSSVEYVREPKAKYPPAARALKQRGTVMLRALVDASGHAREVNVHRSSGHRVLDDAARTAVAQALFKPYSENGNLIPVYVLIPIEFGVSG